MTSIDLEDPDLMLARQLQDQFDREAVEISSGEEDQAINISDDYQLAVELQRHFNEEAVELSDDDDVVQAVDIPTASGSDTPRAPTGTSTTVIEEDTMVSGSEVRPSRAERFELNPDEYFIEELQTYVDSENNFEWKFIEVMPNIKAIFMRLDELFFQSRFKSKNFNVIWSQAIGEQCTNRNFNDVNGRYTIALNETLLVLRPRIEIISILLVSILPHSTS